MIVLIDPDLTDDRELRQRPVLGRSAADVDSQYVRSGALYSIDFRTVDASDLLAGRGAESLRCGAPGTSVRDFRKIDDRSAFDEDMVTALFGSPLPDVVLVFAGPQAQDSQ